MITIENELARSMIDDILKLMSDRSGCKFLCRKGVSPYHEQIHETSCRDNKYLTALLKDMSVDEIANHLIKNVEKK